MASGTGTAAAYRDSAVPYVNGSNSGARTAVVAAAALLVALATLAARPGAVRGPALDSTRWVRRFPEQLEVFASELFQRVPVTAMDSTDPVARVAPP